MDTAVASSKDWMAAAALGLLSSTYSTLISELAAARIGRDAAIDWMTVASIPARDWILSAEPTWASTITGIAFHQWADISWALLFFGAFHRFTSKLKPHHLMILALPWALFTSALEWLFLVPLIPFWQPVFTLQQPYWIGFLVHLSSASIYPLYPWLRSRLDHMSFACPPPGTAMSAAASCLALLSVAGLAAAPRELPWWGRDEVQDRSYIRNMVTHHAQGVELAAMAVGRVNDPHLRKLAALMLASQRGENRLFAKFWHSWFSDPLEWCSAEERAAMPGYLTTAKVEELRNAPDDAFDNLFISLMTGHHKGAVAMADSELRGAGNPRLRLMAHAIRHEQQGEIALMHQAEGASAVQEAWANMFADNVNNAR